MINISIFLENHLIDKKNLSLPIFRFDWNLSATGKTL